MNELPLIATDSGADPPSSRQLRSTVRLCLAIRPAYAPPPHSELSNRLYARVTSAFGIRPPSNFRFGRFKADANAIMAESLKFTRCLLELPKFTINDVRRIVRMCTTTPQSKLEKGFKFYVSSYLCNYEDDIT
ncbi:hypothetical protein QQF64_036041 [Cirrhinus molitorella]|uniref:Uncharacterized protein n=1 Tax=Cirrhinus molitorella TaxID=172907 RepID=A0ABR3NHF9_9TELE